ncbi:MAG: M48 family metalloprotease, partial [Steroidobacteraceae bacterium]
MHWRVPDLLKRFVVALGAAALVTGSAVAAAQSEPELPDIGNPAGALISDDDAYAISLMELRQLRAQSYLLDDPESTEYIQDLGARIASQAPDQPHPISYVVARDDEINSDSIGDLVIMWSGLIIATDNESELAGVMAHETAHCTQRHLARGVLEQRHETIAATAAMLAAVVLGAMSGGYQGPDIMEGGFAAAEGLAAQRELNYSRTQEWEADRVGMRYLSKAGFSPYGIADFFQTLESRNGFGYEEGLYPKFLSNHPITPDRIADARARAANLPQPKNLHDS